MKGRLTGTRIMTLGALDFVLLLMLPIMSAVKTTPAEEMDVETAVCGSFREPFVFWLWQTMAGSPDPERVAGIKDVEPHRFKTRDGINLHGYKLAAPSAKGYLLVAQGNAMLADHLVGDLQFFRDLGLDVFIFDYRGYGTSEGKSRLAAIVADYLELIGYLNSMDYSKRLLYGISMGGVILLNAAGRDALYTRLVVDSSPSRISNLGCPRHYDPIAHLPDNASRIMIISGARDSVVKPRQMNELIGSASSHGARIMQDREFAHPYQEAAEEIHRRRQNEVAAFLLEE